MDDIESEGLDHCYDCTAEIYILHQYFTRDHKINNTSDLQKRIAELSAKISRFLHDKTRPSIIEDLRTLAMIPKK